MVGKEVSPDKARRLLEKEGKRMEFGEEILSEVKDMGKGTWLMFPAVSGSLAQLGIASLIASVGKGRRVFFEFDGVYVYREP